MFSGATVHALLGTNILRLTTKRMLLIVLMVELMLRWLHIQWRIVVVVEQTGVGGGWTIGTTAANAADVRFIIIVVEWSILKLFKID